mmetsp:Transcript_23344/g.17772  ORF Transcript_23344/g.17772 Transcript_23344/m.17772 type:complete len:162 (+) Transcript_23344:224-709(+)
MSICNINNAPDVLKKKDKAHKNIFRETAWNINFYDSSILMEVQKIFFSREVSASLHNSTIFEYMQDPINFTNEGDLFYYLSNHFKYEEVKQEVPPGYELAQVVVKIPKSLVSGCYHLQYVELPSIDKELDYDTDRLMLYIESQEDNVNALFFVAINDEIKF